MIEITFSFISFSGSKAPYVAHVVLWCVIVLAADPGPVSGSATESALLPLADFVTYVTSVQEVQKLGQKKT